MVSVGASEQEQQVCLAVIAVGNERVCEPCTDLGSGPYPLILHECKFPGEREGGVLALAVGS